MKTRFEPKSVPLTRQTEVTGAGTKGDVTVKQTETIAAESSVKGEADRLGFKPYTQIAKGDKIERSDLKQAYDKVGTKTIAAQQYAQLGKHDLARRALDSAKEWLGILGDKAKPVALEGEQDMHVGLWKSQGPAVHPLVAAASTQVDEAVANVAALASVKAVDQGPPPWKKTVLLFGSSCNPPTGLGGHGGIAKWGAESLKVDVPNDAKPEDARENVAIDEVWVLPVYKHIFSSKSHIIDFDKRFEMAKLGFENQPGLEGRIKVSDAERAMALKAHADAQARGEDPKSVRMGSIDLVEFLKAENPDTQFVLMFGGDTYLDYKQGKWKGGRDLEEKLPLVAIPRKGVEGVEGSEENAPDLMEISSTKVRSSTDLEFLGDPNVLHPDVLAFMQKHKLFGFADSTTES